ncbi:hypothetical protein A9Q99_24430 [Gammaproteobacteria bacterium 45_16_T64]|nr:hypothetical protein A9Q99_24430 [Gammaproteobacteria bacterium 45_16_T64]
MEKQLLAHFQRLVEQRRADALGSTLRHPKSTTPIPRTLLLSGYCGSGNVGADIRMNEIIRQIQHIFQPKQVKLAYTSPQALHYGAYNTLPWEASTNDPDALFAPYDGVIVCEGSLFKSQFSNVMAISLIGALGLAASENKVSVAYGAEAGKMDKFVAEFASDLCKDSLLIARSEPSKRLIEKDLNLPAELGADTAWTFSPSSPEKSRKLLMKVGWNGKDPIICVAPINPFWWPVRPDLEKAAALSTSGEFKDIHHRSIFFHHDSEESRGQYQHYIQSIAQALNTFQRESGGFIVIAGMESLDRTACKDLNSLLKSPAPIFMSGDYSMYDIVSVLRQAHIMVSSRYHALVTSIPGGVPGIGITMDERIRNLQAERHAPECVLETDAPDLQDKLITLLRQVHQHHHQYTANLPEFIESQLNRMSKMGQLLAKDVTEKYPEINTPNGHELEDFLPPLPSTILDLLYQGVAS